MAEARPVMRPGDRVYFDGDEHLVTGLSGVVVRLRSDADVEQVVPGHLLSAPNFAVLDGGTLTAVEPFGLLETLSPPHSSGATTSSKSRPGYLQT